MLALCSCAASCPNYIVWDVCGKKVKMDSRSMPFKNIEIPIFATQDPTGEIQGCVSSHLLELSEYLNNCPTEAYDCDEDVEIPGTCSLGKSVAGIRKIEDKLSMRCCHMRYNCDQAI